MMSPWCRLQAPGIVQAPGGVVPWQESYRWATNSRLSRGGLNYFYDIFVSLKYFHSVPSTLENTVVLLGA